MNLLRIALVVGALSAVGCGDGSGTSSMMPTGPSGASMSGTWSGTASDSSGSMMGAGMSSSMMGSMSWQVTQAGGAFSGQMQFAGYQSRGTMSVSGAMNGTAGTFSMNIPSGSMMSGTCVATAQGTVELNAAMTEMHGTYSGTNSCTGAFDHGVVSLVRR